MRAWMRQGPEESGVSADVMCHVVSWDYGTGKARRWYDC